MTHCIGFMQTINFQNFKDYTFSLFLKIIFIYSKEDNA